MIKLFAILTVLASIPFSALADQVPVSKPSAIHCTKDEQDNAYAAPAPIINAQPVNATIAS